jgi:hypothetical protein
MLTSVPDLRIRVKDGLTLIEQIYDGTIWHIRASFDTSKQPESVVHPISPEHPLVVGDVVAYGAEETKYVVTSIINGQCRVGLPTRSSDSFGPYSVISGKGGDLRVRRISHAPTPEPLAAQKADLLEEADRVKAEIDAVARQTANLSDEALECELQRRRASPARQLAELREDWLSSPVVAKEYSAAWLDNFERYARLDERELIKQEGGSHE